MEYEDACFVVRSVGERTTNACREILASQAPGAGIVSISETPQSVAVRRTFEIGLDVGAPWTVAVDADVLVRPNGVETLLELADAAPRDVWQVQVELLDKAFGISRTCGLKALRTESLGQAARLASDIGSSARPDTYVAHEMRARGHGFVKHAVTLGLHDFEQHYHDLFRKGSLHARKHGARMDYARPMWVRLGRDDGDYLALLLGAESGSPAGNRSPKGAAAPVDVRSAPEDVHERLRAAGLEPKQEIPPGEISPDDIERLLSTWVEPPEVTRHLRWRRTRRKLIDAISSSFDRLSGGLRSITSGVSSRPPRAS